MFGSGDLGMGVTFSLRDQASAAAAAAGQSIVRLDRVVANAQRSIQDAANKITSGLIAVTTSVLLLVGPFASALEASGEFNFQIARAGAISKASAADIERLRASAIDYGNDSIYTATEIAKSYFVLSQAGYAVNQQIEMLPNLMNLATAGVVSLEYAATVASDTMYQFGLTTRDMKRIGDVIVQSANQSMVSVENFSAAMKYFGPHAKTFQISLEEAAAYIEVMANSGMRGSVGTRAFGTALTEFARPGKIASEVLKELFGNSMPFWENGKFIGLIEMVRKLEDVFQEKNPQYILNKLAGVFNAEAMQEINQLLTLEMEVIQDGISTIYKGADALEYFTQQNMIAGDVAEKVSKGVMNNYKMEVKLLTGAFETLKITIGSILEGPLRPFVRFIKDAIVAIQGFVQTRFGSFLVQVAAGAAAAAATITVLGFAVGVLIPAVWSLVTAMAALLIELWPFILAGALVAGAIGLLIKSFKDFQAVMNGEQEPAKGFMGLLQRIGGVLMGVYEVWTTWNGETFTMSEQLHNALQKIGILDFVLTLSTWVVRIKEFFTGMIEGLVLVYVVFEQTFSYLWQTFNDFIDVLEELGLPIRKLIGDVGLFRMVGMALGLAIGTMLMPIKILATVLSFILQTLELIVVNFKEIAKIGFGAMMTIITRDPSWLKQSWDQADFKNPFSRSDESGTIQKSKGVFDYGSLMNRQSEIMTGLGLKKEAPSGVVGPMPKSNDIFHIHNYIDGEKVSDQIINKLEIKSARQ
jgi:TP901 family phage tail tape measure protein